MIEADYPSWVDPDFHEMGTIEERLLQLNNSAAEKRKGRFPRALVLIKPRNSCLGVRDSEIEEMAETLAHVPPDRTGAVYLGKEERREIKFEYEPKRGDPMIQFMELFNDLPRDGGTDVVGFSLRRVGVHSGGTSKTWLMVRHGAAVPEDLARLSFALEIVRIGRRYELAIHVLSLVSRADAQNLRKHLTDVLSSPYKEVTGYPTVVQELFNQIERCTEFLQQRVSSGNTGHKRRS